jgi:ABC-type transport system substrate-binding protein
MSKFKSLALLLVVALVTVAVVLPQTSQAQDFEPMSYSAPDCDYGGIIKSIEAVDQYTVKFTLCVSDPAFPAKAAFSSNAIHSSDYLEATGGGGDLIQNPVGTGPYRMEEWTPGESITFKRNDAYWGTPAIAETLVFRWNAEGAARLNELLAGTVDGIDNPVPDDFARIREDSSLILYDRPGTNIMYFGFNNRYEPFDDVRVRQAIAMGIDRQRIVDTFYPVGSIVATQFMPPSIFGYTPEVTWYDFDPEAARALLAEAGYPDGFETQIHLRDVARSYVAQPVAVAQDVAAQLEENLNIKVEVVIDESTTFLDRADQGEFGFHLLGWGADYPDATNFLDYHFGGGASEQFGDKDPVLTDLLAQAAALSDPAARLEIYVKANEEIKAFVPMIPVVHGGSATVFRADVEGGHASPLGNEAFAVMNPGGRDTFVWMQNGEPGGLYCADETDGEALRACEQIFEPLLAYEVGGVAVVPGLAESYDVNTELTEYTFHLRQGVTFHDGSALDANDVVLSYVVQWDAAHPLHVGRDGSFTYFSALFGSYLNPPPAE